MLDDKKFTFVSRKLGDEVGASAGFGTVGGGKDVSESKNRKQVDLSTDLQQLRKKLAEQPEKITANTNNAITHIIGGANNFMKDSQQPELYMPLSPYIVYRLSFVLHINSGKLVGYYKGAAGTTHLLH
jgi:hypothetical protein